MSETPPPELVAYSRDIIAKGSKSFAMASLLFAPEARASAYLLYAWCRHCDDAIDGQELGFAAPSRRSHDPRDALARLTALTSDALDGKPMAEPVFRALQWVVRHHGIPRSHPIALLDGFAMDVEGRRFATLDDTLAYSYHVAGVVGVMMAIVMGVRDEATLDRASDLGIAFQLTNIARDIVDDANAGRVYLPENWLADAGLKTADLARHDSNPKRFTLGQRLVAAAEPYYRSSEAGLPQLPWRSAWAVATAESVYRKIGFELDRRGPSAWDRRISTTKPQKLAALASGLARTLAIRRREPEPLPRTTLWTRPRA
jgi:15-cis-phytoene synthase